MAREPSHERPKAGIRGRLLVAGVGLLSALVPVYVALTQTLAIQVIGAAAGAVLFTAGFGLARVGWERRRDSELHGLGVASGFLLCCLGVFAMTAGIGLYH